MIGCNIINNCGKHAVCMFDYNELGYRCKCNAERVRLYVYHVMYVYTKK